MGNSQTVDADNNGPHHLIRWMKRARPWLVYIAVLVAVLGVIADVASTYFDIDLGGQNAATSPLTAISIMWLALAILTSERRNSGLSVSALASVLAIAVCVIPRFSEIIGLPTIQAGIFRGRVGEDTALIISLFSLAVLMRFQFVVYGLAAALLGTGLVMNALIGQSYGLPYFDGQMARATLLALIFINVPVIGLYLHRPLICAMFISGEIGTRTRMMMAVGFLAPWLSGMVLYHGFGVPARDFPIEAKLISLIIWVMLAVTLTSGFLHEKADKKRRVAERKLAQQAFHDPLTGLLNRAGLNKVLNQRWDGFDKDGVPAAILLIDLDHFKTVNDTYGHGAGDAVLREVGRMLTPFLRKEDVIGRWGGEEFLCVVGETNITDLQQIAERVRLALLDIAKLPAVCGARGEIPVSGSIGVSQFLPGDDGFEAAIKRADDSLYVAKDNGRNRVVFDPKLRRRLVKRLQPESALTA